MIVKNNDLRLIVIGDIKLLPGNNQVDSALWNQYRKEYNIDRILESKRLEEVVEKGFNKKAKELEKKREEFLQHQKNIDEHKEKLEGIEDEEEKKKESKELKEKEKVLKEEMKELNKMENEVKEKEFKDFDFQKKEEIIENTYNLKTLEQWELSEPDVAIRVKLEKRIQGIKDKKIKEKYGKPDNHV